MVAPFTSERVDIPADKTLADKVEYDVINDNGTRWQGSQKLK